MYEAEKTFGVRLCIWCACVLFFGGVTENVKMVTLARRPPTGAKGWLNSVVRITMITTHLRGFSCFWLWQEWCGSWAIFIVQGVQGGHAWWDVIWLYFLLLFCDWFKHVRGRVGFIMSPFYSWLRPIIVLLYTRPCSMSQSERHDATGYRRYQRRLILLISVSYDVNVW